MRLTFWFVATALEVKAAPCSSVPEAVVGPEVCHRPTFEMLADAVMKLLAELKVAVLRRVFEVLEVAAVKAALTTEPEPLVETSPDWVVSEAAGAPPVPRAAWLILLPDRLVPIWFTTFRKPRLVI